MPGKAPQNWLALLATALFVLGLLILGLFANSVPAPRNIPYSEFQKYLDTGKIGKVTLSGDTLTGELRDIPAGTNPHFRTQRVPVALAADLAGHGVEFAGVPGAGGLGVLLSWIIPPLIFVGVWLLASGGMSGGGGVLSVGRSKARLVAETEIDVSFADVAGVDEAKAELHEIVDFLKRPAEFTRLGARIPRGVLLVGPPGTGKTLLARAIAGEAGVPFFSTNGAEFVEMFVGVGAARVRDLFERAGEVAPAIIFIDELDALGRARTANPISGQDEKEQTLNQLLAEMDGFDRSVAIVVLAATNRPEILDPALLRAGRFDRQILVDRPDRKGRADILRIHLKALKLAPDVKLEDLAALTPGFTGADLANLANEAAVIATRHNAAAIGMADFASAVERVVAGLEKRSRVLIPKERRVIAYHEMGHALVAMAIPGTDPVQKVSIIPRGIAGLGYTLQRPTEDRFLMNKHELEDKMTVLLAGRAAEMLAGGESYTGAADDLAKATDIARGMVLRFGMDDSVGPVAWDTEQAQFLETPGAFWLPRRFSEATWQAVDHAVHAILDAALARAAAILQANRDVLDRAAAELLARETMTGEEIPRPVPEAAPPRMAA
ncbi:MAG TPA: ATP-dependent zinc metalloprotease FtsH [Acetobacteraceae bacterium]|nr:ATP-dependent zinc metalloprotease FtsH [Acetobacteraceae bacterium]